VSDTTTRGIRIQVESAYIEERSEPREGYFFFAYRVTITNVGEETAQLLSREWIITDYDGNTETVTGPGVVGEQPILKAGESFEYTSFCPLPTSFGSMQGHYVMRLSSGETFEARIDPFTLAVPGVVN
jgi:ApaG protein